VRQAGSRGRRGPTKSDQKGLIFSTFDYPLDILFAKDQRYTKAPSHK
jgi:hypothetical protein